MSMIFLALNVPSLNAQSKQNHKEFLSKTEINYLYNRLLDEILHNDNLAFICLSDFFKYYDKKDIIVEIDINTDSKILEFYRETNDFSMLMKIPMSSKIKDVPFLNILRIKKSKFKNSSSYFSFGIINISFTDIYYTDSGTFYLGVEKNELIPGVYSKDVSFPKNYILKGVKCPSGQIIINKIMMQNDMEVVLSNATCNC